MWVDEPNREFFPEKLSQGVQITFFLNTIWSHLWILGLTFLKKLISSLWDNFSGKNSLFGSSTHKTEIFEPLRSKIYLSVFALYEMGVAGQCGLGRCEKVNFGKSYVPQMIFGACHKKKLNELLKSTLVYSNFCEFEKMWGF